MVLKYFFILLKKFGYGFKRAMAGLFIMSVIGGFLELLGIAMIFPVMLVLTNSNSTGGEIILNWCKQFFPNAPELKIAFFLAIFMTFVFLFKNLFMMLCIRMQNEFARRWADYVNKDVIAKMLNASYLDVSKIEYGDKYVLLSSAIKEVSFDFMLRTIILFANGTVALCIIALLFYKFTIPAFLSTVFILIWTFVENNFFKEKAKKYGDIEVKLANSLAEDVDFTIKSQKEIIISNKQEYFTDHLLNSSKQISKNFSTKISYGNFPLYVTEMGVIFAFLIMIFAIAYVPDISKEAIISSLAIIGLMVLRLVPQLNKVLISVYAINISKQRVMWFLKKYEQISKFQTENLKSKEGIQFNDNITLQDISFEYENKKGIFGANLNIEKGKFIGIMGLSGAGKTTLANVISGLYPINSGKITVDGVEIDNSNLKEYRNLISFLPQESAFLKDTVLKNITWGEKEADTKKAKEALTKAGLEVDLNSDMNLSLGQKKRVALARCYYNDFKILILDEATSSLDSETENHVMENILKLKGEKTIIAIAHRLSTLKECDKIVYLKEGKIADIGTFDEIRARNSEVEQMIKFSSLN